MDRIPKRDWKLFQELRQVALDRFCRRILDEIARINTESSLSNWERYLKIYSLVQDRDYEMGRTFQPASRSNALMRLALICREGLLTEDERARFSTETQDVIRRLTADW